MNLVWAGTPTRQPVWRHGATLFLCRVRHSPDYRPADTLAACPSPSKASVSEMTFNCAFSASSEAALVSRDLRRLARQQVKVVVGELHIEIAKGKIDVARQHR